jgi:hypothetical protein
MATGHSPGKKEPGKTAPGGPHPARSDNAVEVEDDDFEVEDDDVEVGGGEGRTRRLSWFPQAAAVFVLVWQVAPAKKAPGKTTRGPHPARSDNDVEVGGGSLGWRRRLSWLTAVSISIPSPDDVAPEGRNDADVFVCLRARNTPLKINMPTEPRDAHIGLWT